MNETHGPETKWKDALDLARSLPRERLVAEPLEQLIVEVAAAFAPQPVVIDYDHRYADVREDSVGIRYPGSGSVGRLGFGFSSRGDQHELHWILSPGEGVLFTAENLKVSLNALENGIKDKVREVNAQIEAEAEEIATLVAPVVEQRWTFARTVAGALTELNIPLRRDPATVRVIPAAPSPLSLTTLTAASASGRSEWVLADELADGVIETIASFGRSLERSPSAASRLVGGDEETLRDVLLCILNSTYQGLATGETFIGDGKSDVLLRWRNRDAFVGECKMWRGSAALSAGVDQLLSRYTLWRQSRVALVVFIDNPGDATKIIEKAHTVVREHARTVTAHPTDEPDRRGDYTVNASGDENRPARLTLLPVVLRKPRGFQPDRSTAGQ